MITEMVKYGIAESEIHYYLKQSDEVFLNQLLNNKKHKKTKKRNRILKTALLILALIFLTIVLYGYITIGIIGLLILWRLLKLTSYRR